MLAALLTALATGILALIIACSTRFSMLLPRAVMRSLRSFSLSSSLVSRLMRPRQLMNAQPMEVSLGRQQCRAEVDKLIADAARHNDLVAQEVRQLHEAINELKRLVQSTQKDVNRLASAVAMHRTQTGSFRLDPAPADDEGENGGEPSK